MSYRLGIDVGTTYTAAAVSRSSGQGWSDPESVTLGTRGASIASVLYIADDGSVVVGEAAERRAVTDPDRVVRQFKRRIGDRTPIYAGGRGWAPEDLSARLVRWVVDRVAEREGGPADAIAITHPASWGPHKKELFAGALGAQGLTVSFLAEPQAAALSYAASERVANGSTIAVYDLGGGTFDAAVVHKADGAGPSGFGLMGRPEGLERLGGIDFDQVVFDHVRDGLPDAFAQLDDTDPAVLSAVAQIRRECTEAKEALSSDTEVSIPVMLPNSRGSVRLHRSEFEGLIYPQVEDTVTALRRAVQSAGLAPEQLTAVLLVGGSSRIPLVGQLVSEQLGRPVAVDADPKNAIAKGAALAIAPRPVAQAPQQAPPSPPQSTGGHRRGGGAAAAGAAGLAAGAAAGAAMPPPPRPGRSSLPQQQAPSSQPQQSWQPPPSGGRQGSAPPPRPVHEPANALFSGNDEPPARPRRRAEPVAEPADWEYDDYDGRRRDSGRPTGLLLGVGGVLAAAAVIAGVLIWNANRTTSAGTSPTAGETTTSSEPAATPPKGQNQPTRAPGKANPPAEVPTTKPTPPPATTTKAPEPPTEKTTTAAPPANNSGDNGSGPATGPTGSSSSGDTPQGSGSNGSDTGVAAVPTGMPGGQGAANPVADSEGPVVRTA